jgi:hypothetical protein
MKLHRHSTYCLIAVLLYLAARPAVADTVDISIPSSLAFVVWDIAAPSTGSPDPFHIGFENANLTSGNRLKITVKANGPNFTSAVGSSIPAGNASWTTANAVGGAGSGGTLSSSAYTQVFLSSTNPSSGGVDLLWTLAAPGQGVKAASHSLTITWKIESL